MTDNNAPVYIVPESSPSNAVAVGGILPKPKELENRGDITTLRSGRVRRMKDPIWVSALLEGGQSILLNLRSVSGFVCSYDPEYPDDWDLKAIVEGVSYALVESDKSTCYMTLNSLQVLLDINPLKLRDL